MASNKMNADPTKVKLEDVAGRRQIMRSHFADAVWPDEEVLRKKYEKTVKSLCAALHRHGLLKVGQVYFEYTIDFNIWRDAFKTATAVGLAVPDWPWPRRPPAGDESLGISSAYHEWRQTNGHDLPGDVVPLSADELALRLQEAVDKDPRLAGMAQISVETTENGKANLDSTNANFDQEVATTRADNAEKRKTPIFCANEPEDLICPDSGDLLVQSAHKANKDKPVEQIQFSSHHLRLKVWHNLMGHGPYKTPIVGPFEVALPPSLDFHGLVWVEDGKIYKELCSMVHDFLTVGWLVNDGRPVSLVVGFKASHEEHASNHRNCHDLVTLWAIASPGSLVLTTDPALPCWRV
ncbi:uncharacterized protein B0J16DRAFT_374212 [Fusarium flagelliforme]|uniref:uncharacterized protein n=1 Tax=Fusarium flagelliforme TaxID=2675880 RepID=UPI001E8E482D|nr:uncharacterized protein B0J16DRAFT_374212 [Fusarium flagelliforme]KAH7179126.1 hypothetical protein B0J16DRAFT_374212 [Fusarium flagelliforme]